MNDFHLWNVSALIIKTKYSKTQSSYVSISFIQGEVSRIGGTEAGVLPKYKNDIKKYYDWLIHESQYQKINKMNLDRKKI